MPIRPQIADYPLVTTARVPRGQLPLPFHNLAGARCPVRDSRLLRRQYLDVKIHVIETLDIEPPGLVPVAGKFPTGMSGNGWLSVPGSLAFNPGG